MSGITTHVLDTVLGKPAAGIAVRLEMRQDEWRLEPQIANRHNRRRWPLPRSCRERRRRRLPAHIFTGAYFARNGRSSIYPEISITFICAAKRIIIFRCC